MSHKAVHWRVVVKLLRLPFVRANTCRSDLDDDTRPLAAPAIAVVEPFRTYSGPAAACSAADTPVEDRGMLLTGDGHVHSEWSWDTGGPRSAAAGRMEAMCGRALKIGLPALAFTEHLDLTGWVIDPEDLLDHLRPLVGDNGLLIPEPLDVAGYLESVERRRRQFLELRILSGVEFGQPHIDADKARQLVDLSALDRVNGSLHTLPISDESGALRWSRSPYIGSGRRKG